jgi:hypothetical protein
MAAKHKPLRVHESSPGTGMVRIRALSTPGGRRHTRMIEGTADVAAAELVRSLRQDVGDI